MEKKPILYMLIGIPGSGKSTFAKRFQNEFDTSWISRDKIRFEMIKENEDYFRHESEVFQKFIQNIIFGLRNGINVIADATHLNMTSRRKLTYAIDKEFTDYNIVYVIFDTKLETCIARNNNRTGRACVPEDTIRSMYNSFRLPREDEDNRAIGSIIVKGDIINA